MNISRLLILFVTLCAFAPATRGEQVEFKGAKFRIYRLDPSKEKLELFSRDKNGQPYQTFANLEKDLNAQGKRLKFATNSGIYEPGFVPTGLHIEDGKIRVRLNRQPGQGNFYLKPNGVFYLNPDNQPGILETEAYANAGLKPRLAIQSGPLLLEKNRIHPAFNQPSPNKLLRSGVGVTPDGKVIFALTERDPPETASRVNLYTFAEFFRHLGCPDALFLDGDISELYIRGETSAIPPQTSGFAAILAVTEESR